MSTLHILKLLLDVGSGGSNSEENRQRSVSGGVCVCVCPYAEFSSCPAKLRESRLMFKQKGTQIGESLQISENPH